MELAPTDGLHIVRRKGEIASRLHIASGSTYRSTFNSLAGPVYLLTGATSGVGRATALALAREGGRVILLVRSAERGQRALDEIAQTTGNSLGEIVIGDLANIASIRAASSEIQRRFDHLDGVLALAGLLAFEQKTTEEGLDTMFAVNHLGHFALVTQLLGLLQQSPPVRVLTVAGRPQFLRNPKIDFDDLQLKTSFSGMRALSQTLFARVSFAFELARRVEGTGVTSVAFHPGSVGGSSFGQGGPWWLRLMGALWAPFAKNECPIATHLATSAEVEGVNGVFFDEQGRMIEAIGARDDREQGRRLWEESEALIARVA